MANASDMSESSTFSVKYGEVSFDLPMETSLSKMWHLFNEQCKMEQSQDPASLSYKPIPEDHRAWIRGRGDWLEIFDDEFKELLGHFASGPYHILFTDANSPTPSNPPSFSPRLAVRSAPPLERKQTPVPELWLPPQNLRDPLSQHPIEQIDAGDRMILAYRHGSNTTVVLVSCLHLLEWLKSELRPQHQRSVFDLVVEGFVTPDGAELPPMKTGPVVWAQLMSSRCPLRSSFRDLYIEITVIRAAYEEELAALKADTTLMAGACLYDRLQFFVRDLLHLNPEHLEYMGDDDEQMQYHRMYLSSYFFSQSERLRIAFFPGRDGNIFGDIVNDLVKDKASTSFDGNVCSSHDIAPLYRSVFSLDHKFYGSEAFDSAYAKFVKARDKGITKKKQQQAEKKKKAADEKAPPLPKVLDKNDEKYSALEAQLSQLVDKIATLEQECAQSESLTAKERQKLQGKLKELNKQRLRLEKKMGIEPAKND